MTRLSAAAVLLLALPSGAAVAQDTVPPAPSAEMRAVSAVALRPGDVLKVQIWREPDLSGEFQVDLDGVVILPLIGERSVTQVPVRQLREVLLEDYRVHLRNPSINITPLWRVHVLGEVRDPGLFAVDPTVSLAEAVALAGGVTPQGDIRRIQIVRGGEVLRERAGAGEILRETDIRSGDQIYVERRPWIQRNTPYLISTAFSVASLVLTIMRTRR